MDKLTGVLLSSLCHNLLSLSNRLANYWPWLYVKYIIYFLLMHLIIYFVSSTTRPTQNVCCKKITIFVVHILNQLSCKLVIASCSGKLQSGFSWFIKIYIVLTPAPIIWLVTNNNLLAWQSLAGLIIIQKIIYFLKLLLLHFICCVEV